MLANPLQKKNVILCNCNLLPYCSFGESFEFLSQGQLEVQGAETLRSPLHVQEAATAAADAANCKGLLEF